LGRGRSDGHGGGQPATATPCVAAQAAALLRRAPDAGTALVAARPLARATAVDLLAAGDVRALRRLPDRHALRIRCRVHAATRSGRRDAGAPARGLPRGALRAPRPEDV